MLRLWGSKAAAIVLEYSRNSVFHNIPEHLDSRIQGLKIQDQFLQMTHYRIKFQTWQSNDEEDKNEDEGPSVDQCEGKQADIPKHLERQSVSEVRE